MIKNQIKLLKFVCRYYNSIIHIIEYIQVLIKFVKKICFKETQKSSYIMSVNNVN